jgi:hypothetical protein
VVNPDVPRKLGALEKPVPISEELCVFLELTKDELYSRQKITQLINKFVKDNDLQNPENRRYILLESEVGLKLKKLLRDPDQPLTFFNIQRYLKVHYIKVETETGDTPTGKIVNINEVDPVKPPTEVDPVKPPTEVDPGKPPTEVDPVKPPTEVDPVKPPTEVDPVKPPAGVVEDSAVVDETVEVPKKKIIRKVVKKSTQ